MNTIRGKNLVISGNVKYMRIFAGVPRREGVKQQWGCR